MTTGTKNSKFTWPNIINLLMMTFTGMMMIYTCQSVQTSSKSVEISNQALVLSKQTIESSKVEVERSFEISKQSSIAAIDLASTAKKNLEFAKTISTKSLELSRRVSVSTANLAQAATDNLDVSKKSLNEQLKLFDIQLKQYEEQINRIRQFEEKYYVENAPYLAIDKWNVKNLQEGKPVDIEYNYISLRNQIIKATCGYERVVLVDKKFIEFLEGTNLMRACLIDSLYDIRYNKPPRSKYCCYGCELIDDSIEYEYNRSFIINDFNSIGHKAQSSELLTKELINKIYGNELIILLYGSVIYPNYLNKSDRMFVFAYAFNYRNYRNGYYDFWADIILDDNLNFDKKKMEYVNEKY